MNKIFKNTNLMIFLLVAIVIVTNIIIIYTCTYTFSSKERTVQEVTVKDISQKSPIVVEALEENEENLEEIYPTGTTKYYIKVNCKSQTVNVYEKDENNKYSKPVKVMLCSTGVETPKTGVYKITSFKQEWLGLQGNVYGQYCTQIVGNILFHSVPYIEKNNPSSLEYWEYDKLGEEASLGCIRLTVESAKWIFDNCETGTQVEFYSSEDPGPLGKPETQKISDYSEELKNWDPTDEKQENPWIIYKKKVKEQEELRKKRYDAAIQATINVSKFNR
ncbi:MAG: L,D-transpeptidase [Clostridia bacterium]|nr:putative uncharacterized protein [Clostridium sp. CAG:571]HJJ07117.1 L,D-transpeptidase [Clostridiaceae bacterium]